MTFVSTHATSSNTPLTVVITVSQATTAPGTTLTSIATWLKMNAVNTNWTKDTKQTFSCLALVRRDVESTTITKKNNFAGSHAMPSSMVIVDTTSSP